MPGRRHLETENPFKTLSFSLRSQDTERHRVVGRAGRDLPREQGGRPGHLLAELRVAGRIHAVLPRRQVSPF